MTTLLTGIVCLICGIIVLAFPKMLTYIVGIGLIILGVLYLVPHFHL